MAASLKRVDPLPNNSDLFEYKVSKPLGQGGFGTTYLCLDNNLRRKCVIKEYTPHHLVERKTNGHLKPQKWKYRGQFSRGLKKFLDEARRLAMFNHPNLVRVNRYFEMNNTGYFVMDYESGSSLRNLISAKGGQFTEQEIEAIVGPLCEGLKELHNSALIHRDIKPDNIIVRQDGTPVLIDFGAAADLRTVGQVEYQIIATPNYAPLEQLDPRFPQGPWIDIYAIGATMYELIAGLPPPPANERAVNDMMQPASELGRGIYGDRLLGLIDKCLALHYAERPESLAEFSALFNVDNSDALQGIINGISEKTIQHFLNFANPNPGLFVDEFVAFAIILPIIDLSWRIGRGTPTKEIFFAIYKTLSSNTLEHCHTMMVRAGFTTHKRQLTLKTVEGRLDEYASTYLLDRQQDEWTYAHTSVQCARNCLSPECKKDIEGFTQLVADIIDRAKGRVKKEFEKTFRNVVFIKTNNGWRKEIRHFA